MARGTRILSGSPDASAPRDRRRIGWLLFKVAVGIGLVAFLFGSGRIEVSRLLDFQRPLDFVLAQLAWFCGFQLTIFRWRWILRALGVTVRYRDAARLCWLGLLFSQVIPGATGGDVVKGIQIARESPGQRPQAVLSVVLDRTIGLTALMLIGVVGIRFCPAEVRGDPVLEKLGLILVGLIAVVLLGGALLCWRGLWRHEFTVGLLGWLPGRRIIGRLAEALWAVAGRRRLLGFAMLLSVAAHSFFVLTAILLARGLTGETPSIENYSFLVPLGGLAFSLPLTPGGLGVGQWAYEELFLRVGEGHGAELGVLLQLSSVLWALVGVLALFLGGSRISRSWTDSISGAGVAGAPAKPAGNDGALSEGESVAEAERPRN